MTDILAALEPIYTTNEVNQNVVLYAGEIEIKTGINNQSIEIIGSGKVIYKWFPSPKLQFEFVSQSSSAPLLMVALYGQDPQPAFISLIDIEVFDAEITANSLNLDEQLSVIGTISKPIVQGNGQSLSHVVFHVTNFHNIVGRPTAVLKKNGRRYFIERILFEAEGWKITLDQLETTPEIIKSLNAQGGYGITHVGKLERADGQVFTEKEALVFLQIFTDFLSFTRGFYICLGLAIGYDKSGNKIWQHWQNSSGSSWKSIASWCPKQEAKMLSDVFPGFVKWWQNWASIRKTITLLVFTSKLRSLSRTSYCKCSNCIRNSYLRSFCRTMSNMSKTEYRKNKSIDHTRNLFTAFNIPSTIPKTGILLNEIRQFAAENDWVDGVKTLNKMRNSITHPETTKRELFYNASSMTKIGAAYLSLWYLELAFLAMFGYDQLYSNRIVESNLNAVPWKEQTDT